MSDRDRDPFDYDRDVESWMDQLRPDRPEDCHTVGRRRLIINPVTLVVCLAAWAVIGLAIWWGLS